MTNDIRWKFLYSGGKKAHAFQGASAGTSVCGRANVLARGPYVFVPDGYEIPRCDDCSFYVKGLEEMTGENDGT